MIEGGGKALGPSWPCSYAGSFARLALAVACCGKGATSVAVATARKGCPWGMAAGLNGDGNKMVAIFGEGVRMGSA